MPRKKVNGNIIGARWQDIRHRGEVIAVNRRTGGLEKILTNTTNNGTVNRRTGGLENFHIIIDGELDVNRRIGGLEIFLHNIFFRLFVNRRTGGLEKRTKFVR